jgi:regulator of RNase E activity RraB
MIHAAYPNKIGWCTMSHNSLNCCFVLNSNKTAIPNKNNGVTHSAHPPAYPYSYEIESESFCSEDEVSSQTSVDRYSLMEVSSTESSYGRHGKINTDDFISRMYLGDKFLSASGMKRVDIATGRSILALGKLEMAHQKVAQLAVPTEQKNCWLRRKQERAVLTEKIKRSDGLLNEMRYAEQGIQMGLKKSREECLNIFMDCALQGDVGLFKEAATQGKEHLHFLNEMAQEAQDKQRAAARSVDQMDAKTSQRWFSVKENKLCSIFSKKSKKKAQEAWMKDRLKDIQTQLSDLRRKSDDLESKLARLIDGASSEERALYKIAQRSLAQDILALSNIALDVDELGVDIQNQEIMDSFSSRTVMLHKKIMNAYANLDATELMLLGLAKAQCIKSASLYK